LVDGCFPLFSFVFIQVFNAVTRWVNQAFISVDI
jgi:hypothetical protein